MKEAMNVRTTHESELYATMKSPHLHLPNIVMQCRIGHLVQSVILLRDVLTVLPAFVKGKAHKWHKTSILLLTAMRHEYFPRALNVSLFLRVS